jgi:hypothetical protein
MKRAGLPILWLVALAGRLACAQDASPQGAPEQQAPPPGQQPGAPETDVGGVPAYRNGTITPYANVGAVYSDNLDHAASNGIRGTALDASVGLHVRRAGDLTVNADASGLYREYVGGVALPGQFLPSVNANATYAAIPEILYLSAQDVLGQISTQAFDAVADTTRQNSNFFTVGPQLLLPFASREIFVTQLQYGRSSYEQSNISNNRYIGDVGLGRQIGIRTNLSVNYHYQEVEYDHSDLYPRARSSAGFLRFNAEGVRTFLDLEGGWEQVKVGAQTLTLQSAPGSLLPPVPTYEPPENRSSPHINVAVQRRLTPLMTFTAEYNHGVSDASESLRTSAQNGFNPSGNALDVQSVAQPFTVDRGYLMVLRTTPLGSIAVQASGERERYQQDPLFNRQEYGGDVIVSHQLAPQLSFAGSLRLQRGRYVTTQVPDNRFLVSLGLTRQLSRSLQAAVVYERNNGTGQESVIGPTLIANSSTYTENRVTLLLHYSPQNIVSPVFDPVSQFRFFQRPNYQQSGPSGSGTSDTGIIP